LKRGRKTPKKSWSLDQKSSRKKKKEGGERMQIGHERSVWAGGCEPFPPKGDATTSNKVAPTSESRKNGRRPLDGQIKGRSP